MAKYCGKIGFATEQASSTSSDIWIRDFTERTYYGDVLQNVRQMQIPQDSTINENITLSNRISIVADAFAYENFLGIRYATYMGKKWKVTNIDVSHPRMVLTLGGVYNE